MSALAERYRRFAEVEASGHSPIYERLALDVAGSKRVLDFLRTLPIDRQQPNLFLAALRTIAGVPEDAAAVESMLETHGPAIHQLMLDRTTQTNEPNRCAVLLPLLARLPQPLSLIEVGASAGLCLIPDRYDYSYSSGPDLHSGEAGTPVLPCEISGKGPDPAYPVVAWAAGLDLNPLNVSYDDDVAWLKTLVWPEQTDRLQRLDAAIQIARQDPPRVLPGDLTKDLGPLIDEAPKDSRVVVFHTAVLTYVPTVLRAMFRDRLLRSGVHWISVESPRVFPEITARLGLGYDDPGFVVAENGVPVALAGSHGQSLHWL